MDRGAAKLRLAFACSIAVSAVNLSPASMAQQAGQAAEPQGKAITLAGSHIVRRGYAANSPNKTVDERQLVSLIAHQEESKC